MFPPRLFWIYCLYLFIAFWGSYVFLKRWQLPEISRRIGQWTILCAMIINAAFFFFYYLAGHYNFSYGAVDYATIVQTIWNMANGHVPFESILGTHTFRVHFSPLFYLVALLFKLWPTHEWIVFLSVLSVTSVAYILYLIVLHELEFTWLAVAIGLSYLLNPYIQFSQLAAVHAESFCIVPITLSIYFMLKRSWLWFALFMFLGLLGKEDAGLYYFGLGLFMLLDQKVKVAGVLTMAIGTIYSLSVVGLVMPLFGPDTQHLTLKYFSQLGSTLPEIGKRLLFHPWIVATVFLHWKKIFPIFYILAQTGFLSILSGWALLPLIIALALKSITNYTAMINYWDHYFLHVAPFLYFATIMGIKKLLVPRKNDERIKWAYYISGVLILLSLLINLERGQNFLSRKFRPASFKLTENSRVGRQLLNQLPPTASILVQEQLAPEVCFRRHLYAISCHSDWNARNYDFRTIDFVVLDLNLPLAPNYAKVYQQANHWLSQNPDFSLIDSQDGWRIYRVLKAQGFGTADAR